MAKVCNHLDFMSSLPRFRLRCNSCFRKKPGYLTESSIYTLSSNRRSPIIDFWPRAETQTTPVINSPANAQQIILAIEVLSPSDPPSGLLQINPPTNHCTMVTGPLLQAARE